MFLIFFASIPAPARLGQAGASAADPLESSLNIQRTGGGMMKAMSFDVHPARELQIQAFAGNLGVDLDEAIEHLIGLAIEAGAIPEAVPGFKISAADGQIWFVMAPTDGASFFLPPMRPSTIWQLSALLEDTVKRTGRGEQNLHLESNFTIRTACIGQEIVIIGEDAETGRKVKSAVTRRMALDFARQLCSAANEAEAQSKCAA